MPHSTGLSIDTLPSSFTSEDLETSSIAVAQAIKKHHSTVLNIPPRSPSMDAPPQHSSVFTFQEEPLPTIDVKNTSDVADASPVSPVTVQNEPRAVPYQPQAPSQSSVRKKYYDEQFAYKSHPSTARERVTREAPVIADLLTNVIINDEYTLTTDLSYHISTRFQRAESAIAVTIKHSACLCLGGSFQPAYILTITTLPSLIQPATNKRNAALMQSFMSDVLSVSADRGIVRFTPIPEENIAINSRTILSEIEKLEREQGEEASVLRRATSKATRRSLTLRKAKSQDLGRKSSTKTLGTSPPQHPPVLPGSAGRHTSPEPFDSEAGLLINGHGRVVRNVAVASPVDSKMGSPDPQDDRRPGSRHNQLPMASIDMPHVPAPPPVPMDDERKVKKVGKRKSIVAMFRGR